MDWRVWLDALKVANAGSVRLLLTKPALVRDYLSGSARLYDELTGRGLPIRDPLTALRALGGDAHSARGEVRLPSCLFGPGGTSVEELAVLAAVTRSLRPRKVFEIGTYNGKTTCVFILNSPPDTRVISLDLPTRQACDPAASNLRSDRDLIASRRVAQCVQEMGLEDHYEQVLCNSLEFDPAPHADSVELGFIDGGHELRFVQNDTGKMAQMISAGGVVFWHDYGGKGNFRPLTTYLEGLARSIPIYRVRGTTLAWAGGADLKRLRARS